MTSRTVFAALMLIAGISAPHASAAEFPSLVGEWKGMTSPVHVGSTGHAVPTGQGINFTDEFEITFNIKEQKGNDFSGEVTTKNRTEPLVGSIREDKTEGMMVDEDGHYEFKVMDNDTIDLCYWHITSDSRVTTCFALKRSK